MTLNMAQLLVLLAKLTTTFGSLAATARLLLPLAAAQRVFLCLYTAGQDWYTGKYIRTTFL
jgi:hypothetical protein